MASHTSTNTPEAKRQYPQDEASTMHRRRDKHTKHLPRDVERFGRSAPHYERSLLQRFFLNPVQTATIAEIGREVAQPMAVLDVGCGTGS